MQTFPRCILVLILCFTSVYISAQITIEEGAEVTVLAGEIVTLEGNLDNGGIINGQGTINIAGDYSNSGTLGINVGPDQSNHITINVLGTFTPSGNFVVTNDSYAPSSGDQLTIVSSGNSIESNFMNTNSNSWYSNYNFPNSGDFTISYSVVLPVELLHFRVKSKDETAVLLWQTASETNNKGFSIERSVNTINWQEIGFVAGTGNSNSIQDYKYIDTSPERGLNYYRLKQIDLDGGFEYSAAVSLRFTNAHKSVGEFYPNPSQSGLVNLRYDTDKDEILKIRVFDLLGKQLYESTYSIAKGSSIINFNLSKLASGTYRIHLESARSSVFRSLVISK